MKKLPLLLLLSFSFLDLTYADTREQFLKGIKGSADTNGDRSVTAEEIQSYVVEEVPLMARKLNSREQTPGMRNGQDKVIVQF